MFGWMLFLHLAGLSLWLGALLAIVVMLWILKTQWGSEVTHTLAGRIIRAFSRVSHPSAVVVLISGVFLILQMGMGTDKPLWLQVMEKGGGMIILLSLVLTGIWGSRVKKRLAAGQGQAVSLSGYLRTTAVFMVLILSVVLVVSLKI